MSDLRQKLREAITDWHKPIMEAGNCAACNEGLYCCVDPNVTEFHLTGAELESLVDAILRALLPAPVEQ